MVSNELLQKAIEIAHQMYNDDDMDLGCFGVRRLVGSLYIAKPNVRTGEEKSNGWFTIRENPRTGVCQWDWPVRATLPF